MTSQTTNQITTTLQSLLPSYNHHTNNNHSSNKSSSGGENSFPPQLVNLTHSLLQRSRARVPSLKAEEEVARCWVVAEIACHRLKTRLNLPKIESRPPCPPKLYKKVYGYLEGVLADEGQTARTPKKDGSDSWRNEEVKRGDGLERRLPERFVAALTGNAERGVKRPRASTAVDEKMEGDDEQEASESGDESSSESDEEQFVDAGEYIEENGEGTGDDEHETTTKKSSSLGRGSMMESRYDWLSDERRRDYAQWKAGILRQIDEMERAGKRPRTQKQKAVK